MTLDLKLRSNDSSAVIRSTALRAGPLPRKCAFGDALGSIGEREECRNERHSLHRKITGSEPGAQNSSAVPPIVHEVLRSPGHALDSATRSFMEPLFGHDLSRVRIHTGTNAAESARAVAAHAYTVGSEIVFGPTGYAPGTESGRRLLAHELTHVIQQGFTRKGGTMTVGAEDDAFEQQAEAIGGKVSALFAPLHIERATSMGGRNGREVEPARIGRTVIQRDTDTSDDQSATAASNPQPPTTSAPVVPLASPGPAPVCPALPSATPPTCADRHQGYHAAAACFGGNSWLRCVDRVSDDICTAVDAFNFRGARGTGLQGCVAAFGGDKPAIFAKAAWFNDTNSCIWGHWRAATEALNDPSRPPIPSGLTPDWAAAVTACRGPAGTGSKDCCKAQVVAEQNAIDACAPYDAIRFGPHPTDVPGSKRCSSLVAEIAPGQAFIGDFSKVSDRITYGLKVCGCS